MLTIRKAAVIGAGTMGAQIAAHLANVGIPSLLLDVVPTELTPEEQTAGLSLKHPDVRNRITRTLWERALKLSPCPLYLRESAGLVTLGNIEDDLPRISDADWVIEAILEKIDLKRQVHANIAAHARHDAIVTTNTSGLPMRDITEGLAAERRHRFFGTHFFNPPRMMRLLELIPTKETDRALLQDFSGFAERVLGKGVVFCKDTPGFIANRLGAFAWQQAFWLTLKEGLTFDEVDAITGSLLGRPRSATFRLADIVGIDLLAQIGSNFMEALENDDQREIFRTPPFVEEMIRRGWLGQKTGRGCYQRVREGKDSGILTLDYRTMEYRPRQPSQLPDLEKVAGIADLAERLRTLCNSDERAGSFAWKHLSAVLVYAATHVKEIADDIPSVDHAMQWGFNWELGPFETWDALGVAQTADRLKKEGRTVPPIVKELLASGKSAFYQTKDHHRFFFHFQTGEYQSLPSSPHEISLSKLRRDGREIVRNDVASLLDLGDGVACMEFHTKMNALDAALLEMALNIEERVRRDFVGLVIGNQGAHFSAGANLGVFQKLIQEKHWADLDQFLRLFQRLAASFHRFEKPVVVACHGYTLGGGCELTMGADHVVAAAESYVGLPEIRVGLIPAGGGCKEMLIRCTEDISSGPKADYFSGVKQAWETILLGRISDSAHEACAWKYLRQKQTEIIPNQKLLLGHAKARVLRLAAAGYQAGLPRDHIPALGQPGQDRLKARLDELLASGQITDYDMVIGEKLMHVLCGGKVASPGLVNEQTLFDLEREGFLSLCGDVRTMERLDHMLQHGKPLRN